MNLSEDQKKTVADWIAEGLRLSEIQSRLAKEMGLNLTYMELRFLLDDLSLRPKDQETRIRELPDLKSGAPGKGMNPKPDSLTPEDTDEGGLSLMVDRVTRPGALVSGNVTFSDGQSAEWYLDQMGRLGVVPKQAGYKPSQADIMDFQAQLQSELAKLGF